MSILFYRCLYRKEMLNARIIHSFLMAMDNNNIASYIRKGLFLNKFDCEKSVSHIIYYNMYYIYYILKFIYYCKYFINY